MATAGRGVLYMVWGKEIKTPLQFPQALGMASTR